MSDLFQGHTFDEYKKYLVAVREGNSAVSNAAMLLQDDDEGHGGAERISLDEDVLLGRENELLFEAKQYGLSLEVLVDSLLRACCVEYARRMLVGARGDKRSFTTEQLIRRIRRAGGG